MDDQLFGLVRVIAGKYARYGVQYDDLVQEGMIGLWEAQRRYDPEKGASLATYAGFWIKKRILLFLDRELREKASPLPDNLRDELTDVETPASASESLPETMFPPDMPETERSILRLQFEQNHSLSEVASRLGKSREWVRQRRQMALRRIRRSMGEK
jgi:RNA polymerase sigma factor (sigma-70 family)